jgi:hypothetical protein
VEVVESSSAPVALTTEEVMQLTTCRYIDFPSVGVIDLEAPQLPEKVYEVAAKRMFNEPTIMETITSVSKALQEYEHTVGFAPAEAADAEDVALTAPATHVEPTADASVPLQVDEGREASSPKSVEGAEALAPVAKFGAAEAVVEGVRTSLPHPVAAEADGVETRVLGEPTTIVQESAAPEMMTRAASPEIQEAEETGASLSQGVVGGEALLTDKRCIHLRSASVRTYTFFTMGFPRFLSIRGARGLQEFDLPLLTSYSNPNYN